MVKATDIGTGQLKDLYDCYILIPVAGNNAISLDNLPDISDSKNVAYNQEPIIGRSNPLITYSHSDARTINMVLHFFVTNGDFETYINYLRLLESATYPQDGKNGAPFAPPPVCQIKCGKLLGNDPLCCVLMNYNVKFPTDVVWDNETKLPIKFDVDTNWTVVYSSNTLPTQDRIFTTGR